MFGFILVKTNMIAFILGNPLFQAGDGERSPAETNEVHGTCADGDEEDDDDDDDTEDEELGGMRWHLLVSGCPCLSLTNTQTHLGHIHVAKRGQWFGSEQGEGGEESC